MNRQRTRLRSALAVILTVLVLVPTGILFTRVWQDNSDKRSQAEREQRGVEYLDALSPLISSLAEYQSTALQGVGDAPESLKGSIARVADVDARLGEDLRTSQRWAGLQAKIAKLANTDRNNPLATYQAHVEVTDLTLALYGAIRRNSELNRDPDNDMSNLQQAAAIDMPRTVVLVGRMGDLAGLLQSVTGPNKAVVGAQFGQELLAVQDSVNGLTDSLQAAVDDTDSATLSGGLVSTLDAFRRGVESMTRGANPGDTPNLATMSTAQSSLKTALAQLSGTTLKEMESLLDDRLDTLSYRRIEAIAMGLLAVVLVLGALLAPAFGRRREMQPASRPVGEATRDIPLTPPPGPGYGYGGNPYGQAPGFGAVDPTRREQSGALR